MELNKFGIAGDRYIQDSSTNEVYQTDIVAAEASDIGHITKEQLLNVLGGNVYNVAERNDILKALG